MFPAGLLHVQVLLVGNYELNDALLLVVRHGSVGRRKEHKRVNSEFLRVLEQVKQQAVVVEKGDV